MIRVIVLGEVDDVDARHSRAAKAVRGSVEKKRERGRLPAAKNLGTPELPPPIRVEKRESGWRDFMTFWKGRYDEN